jgi:predicted MFS family arabinose efflux permease
MLRLPTPFSTGLLPLISALGLTQVIGFGSTFYILAVLARPIGAALGLSMGFVLSGLSLWLAVGALLGPRMGRWQDQFGARRVMVTGSLLQVAGLAALAFAQGLWSYYAAWAILGAAAPLALYSAAFTALTQVSPLEARRSISALTFIGGFASTGFWPLTSWLMTQTDWRSVVLIYAALNLLICLPIHALMLGAAKGITQKGGDAGESVPPGLPHEGQNIAFILFAGMLSVQALVFYGVTTLIFPMLGALGYAGGLGVLVASLIGPLQVAGRIADMIAASRVSALTSGLISALLLPLAFASLAFLPVGLVAGALFAAFYGVSNGLLTIARGGVTLAIFGSHGYGERLNRVMVPQNILGAAAPIIGGVVLDGVGAGILVPILLSLALFSAALMLMLKRHCARHKLK